MQLQHVLFALMLTVPVVAPTAVAGEAGVPDGIAYEGNGPGFVVPAPHGNTGSEAATPATLTYATKADAWTYEATFQPLHVALPPGYAVTVHCESGGPSTVRVTALTPSVRSAEGLENTHVDVGTVGACTLDARPTWSGEGPARVQFTLAGEDYEGWFLVEQNAGSAEDEPVRFNTSTARIEWWAGDPVTSGSLYQSAGAARFGYADASTYWLVAQDYEGVDPGSVATAPLTLTCISIGGRSMGTLHVPPGSASVAPTPWDATRMIPTGCGMPYANVEDESALVTFAGGAGAGVGASPTWGARVSLDADTACPGRSFNAHRVPPWTSPTLAHWCGVDSKETYSSVMEDFVFRGVYAENAQNEDELLPLNEGWAIRRFALQTTCPIVKPVYAHLEQCQTYA